MTLDMCFDLFFMLLGAVLMICSVSVNTRLVLAPPLRWVFAAVGFVLAMYGTLHLIDSYIEFAIGAGYGLL